MIHEPPLFGIIKDNPKAQEALQILNGRIKGVLDLFVEGNLEQATAEFMEKIGMGAGEWEKLPEVAKKTFIHNALTWYDEMQDPQSLQIDITSLSNFKKPALLSSGSESPPFFPLVINKLMSALPQAKQITIGGAGHVPHISHPNKYVEIVCNFCFSVGNESNK